MQCPAVLLLLAPFASAVMEVLGFFAKKRRLLKKEKTSTKT